MASDIKKKLSGSFIHNGWLVLFLLVTFPIISFFLGIIYERNATLPQRSTLLNPSTPTTPVTPHELGPYILNLSPTTGDIGTRVTVSGMGFSPSENYVVFGSAYLGPFPSSDGKITFSIPDKAEGGCNRPFAKGILCMAIIMQQTNPGSNYNVSVLTSTGESNKISIHVASSPH